MKKRNPKQYDLKVLSIDFDYFQDVLPSTVRRYYPDGIDMPTDISSMIWSSHYNKYWEGCQAIQDVYIDLPLLIDMKNILKMQREETECVINQSHFGIWREITDRCPFGGSVMVAHVDFHHDFVNGNEEFGYVDCGNWMWWLTKKYDASPVWFTRSSALELYQCGTDEIPCHIDDLSHLRHVSRFYDFDLIYLCRSDQWIPPHLDKFFDELVDLCQQRFYSISIEDSVNKPRDMASILNNAREIEKQYEILGGMHNADSDSTD